jgi:hypothetical protein
VSESLSLKPETVAQLTTVQNATFAMKPKEIGYEVGKSVRAAGALITAMQFMPYPH